MARIPFVAGNWKMNSTLEDAKALAEGVRQELESVAGVDVAVCPPFVNLGVVKDAITGSKVALGAQNVHWETSGAFTGEVAPDMLEIVGCKYVIVGHSERRLYFGETDETVNKRIHSVLKNSNMELIVCLGETKEEREGGTTEAVVQKQLSGGFKDVPIDSMARITIAYEPVWAIGTGLTATPEQAQEVHAFLRKLIAKNYDNDAAGSIRIQYGGSVKPDNAKELLSCPDIDGALVGGASLKADSFAAIVKAGAS